MPASFPYSPPDPLPTDDGDHGAAVRRVIVEREFGDEGLALLQAPDPDYRWIATAPKAEIEAWLVARRAWGLDGEPASPASG